MNQPDTPTISVDEPSVARVSMLVKGSFGHNLEDITSYGVEFSDVLFEKDGTYTVLTPQEVTEDGFSLGITNLTPNKTYYLRSFISNGHSSLYSSVLTQKMPETSVASVSDVSLSADGNYLVAMIEDDGGRSVEDVGFVWGDTNDRRALRREKRYPATIGLDGRTFTLPVSALGNKTRYVLAYAEDDKEATGFSRIAYERFVAEPEPTPEGNFLVFTSDGVTTISLTNYKENSPILYYSTDAQNWKSWDYSELSFSKEEPLFMYGDNPTGFSKSSGKFSTFTASGDLFSISGDIMHLLDNHSTMSSLPCNFCFFQLFRDCAALKSAPDLTAETLSTGCYMQMFMECSNLVSAPRMAPTIVATSSCCNMFYNCSKMETAPELPATIMEPSCYSGMFCGCASLVEAPALPATVLAETCYNCLFLGCSSLRTTPELPAAIMAKDCYAQMFSGCSKLTVAPELASTTLAESCYFAMFMDCKGITEAPTLPATQMARQCYYSMFAYSGITAAPELPATKLAEACYREMFHGCSALTEAPALPATTLAPSCYYRMFRACHSLYYAPSLPASVLVDGCYKQLFSMCTRLIHIQCLAEDISAPECVEGWVDDVASAGEFIKSSAMNDWPEGVSGIPEGWTVKDYEGVQPNNEIWYTSTDGSVIEPNSNASFGEGVSLVSNTYENGQGIMTFSGPVTKIGDWSFHAANNLSSILLPESIVSIGDYSFNASSMETIHIPDNVTSIAEGCFCSSAKLTSFTGKFASEDGRALIVDGTMVAFAPGGLQEYTVDASARVLGKSVFSDCIYLEKIHFPEGMERINNSCFHQCWSLTQVEFPSSLKYIEQSAFPRCQNLTSLTFPNSEFTVMRDAFNQCPKLEFLSGNYVSQDGRSMIQDNTLVCVALAGLEEYVVPDGVTSTCTIHGFQDGLKSLKRIVYPETVTQIGQIWDCESLQSITVKAPTPPSFIIIMSWADESPAEICNTNDCPIYVPAEAVEAYKSAERWSTYANRIQPIVEGQPTNEIWYTTVDDTILNGYNPDCFNVSITSNSYEDGKGVLTFESPLTSIVAWGAFQGSNLKSIQLPGALENLGEMMFVDCPYLESIEIPESVTSLSYWGTCLNCPRLSSFSGKFASSDHRALIIDGTMNSFAPYGLTEYTVPTNVSSIGYSVFRLCRELTSVILTDNIKSMGVGVFSDASSLRSISLPSSLTSIPQAAFDGCTSLITIHIPENIIDIGPYAFDNCTSLSSFTGKYASQDGRFLIKNNTLCGIALSGMEEVIIPDGIQSACSIFYAQELKRVVYPESITSMGHVYECQNLNEIVVSAINPPRAVLTRSNSNGDPTFLKESNNCPIYVPAGSIEAYKAAEYWSEYADRIQAIQ